MQQTGRESEANPLTLLDQQPFKLKIPEGYFTKALRISHTLFKIQTHGAITENEYVLLLARCVQRAKTVFETISKFFLIKNDQFLV